MKKKRILIVAPSNKGTIAMCTLNLYKAFFENPSFEVKCVIVHRFRNGLSEFEECESCVTYVSSIYTKFFGLIKQTLWLKSIKQNYRPDITISTMNSCSVINVLSGGYEKKVGIIHCPHTQTIALGYIIYLYTLFIFRFIFPKLDKLACVSEEIKDSILNSFSCYKHKYVEVIANLHNMNEIMTKSNEQISSDEEKIITSNSLLYLGRLDKNKAPMRALKAFNLAIESLPKNANLLFIGNDQDNLLASLEAYVRCNSISNRVYFLGFQSNPYKYLARVKCLISTSYSEGLPGAMVEALYLNKPVISTNSSKGVWEILSCHEYYQPLLDDIFVTNDGVISSNLSVKEKSKKEFDILNLSKAILNIYEKKKQVSFRFNEQLAPDIVIEKILRYII